VAVHERLAQPVRSLGHQPLEDADGKPGAAGEGIADGDVSAVAIR
jgi:hypothetical protein